VLICQSLQRTPLGGKQEIQVRINMSNHRNDITPALENNKEKIEQ
jgi:hypothetical protein